MSELKEAPSEEHRGPTSATDVGPGQDTSRRIRSRRFLVLLGLPALGLTFAVTAISTYLPVIVSPLGGPILAGMLVGGEGLFGIFLPLIIGARSDAVSSTVAGRLRYIRVAAVVAAGALGVLALAGPLLHSVVAVGVAVALFYVAYYGYLSPYWAIYPDLVPDEQSGRSRSAESSWRLAGSGLALILGGVLLGAGKAIPFAVAAALVVATTVYFLRHLADAASQPVVRSAEGVRRTVSTSRRLLRDRDVRLLMGSVVAWNFALSGLRAFVVLFFVEGLGRSTSFVSLVIFPLAAVGFLMAPLAGRIADRIGHRRVVVTAVIVYGGGLLLPGFSQHTWVLAGIPIVAAGAATTMTLEYSLVMRLVGEDHHGAAAGLYGFFRGLGATLGPIVSGLAIVVSRGWLSGTHGYAAMWLLVGVVGLISLPLFLQIGRDRL